MRWAQDFYEFQEGQVITVELVTDSDFEVASVAISGRPSRIPDSDPSTLPSLDLLGPDLIPGNQELYYKLNGATFCGYLEIHACIHIL